MNWHIKTFDELTKNDIYAIFKLRQEVFIVEQSCIYLDIDDYDKVSIHIFAFEKENLVAYCRIVFPNIKYPEPSIGRVVVSRYYRNQNIGTELIEKAIQYHKKFFPKLGNRISAQAHLKLFYQNLGFKVVSDAYLEDGIPHIEMLRESF